MFRLETLERQRATIEGNLKDVSQKLIIAQRGELLERDQHAERLQILEQPVLPTEPVKGKRLAFLAMVIGASFAAGLGGVMVAELFDRTIRGTSDLEKLVDLTSSSASRTLPPGRKRCENGGGASGLC